MEPHEYDLIHDLEEGHWWFRARRRIVSAALDRFLPHGRAVRALDFGCGPGGTSSFLLRRPGIEAHGVDVCPRAIEFCRERGLDVELIPERGWAPQPESLDLVVALDVLEHVEHDAEALRGLWAGLRPAGVILIVVPAYQWLWTEHDVSLHHHRRHSTRTLDALARDAGIGAWAYRSYFNTWLFPMAATVRLAKKLIGRGGRGGPASRAHSDTQSIPPPFLNRTLEAIFASERHLVGRLRLPFGLSMIAWAIKPGEGETS